MAIEEFVNAKGGFDDPIDECDELVLDGLKLKTIAPADTEYLTKFTALETLSMNQCHLAALEGLPVLPKLQTIELQDNRLQGSTCIEALVARCPNLRVLLLAGNRFQSLDELSSLAKFQHLEEVDVDMNPLTAKKDQQDSVRRAIFGMIPGIQIVNSCDLQGNEVVTDEDSSSDSEEVAESTNEDADMC